MGGFRWCVAGMAVAFAVAAADAGGPARYSDSRALGLTYRAWMRGQTITDAAVPSHERAQYVMLSYAPVEYVRIDLGAGILRYAVDEYNGTEFAGALGFSPAAGLSLFSPALFKLVRATGGLDVIYMHSEDEGYAYLGPVFDPYLGLILHAGRYIDVEAGALAHVIAGTMKEEGGGSGDFSNSEVFRGYVSVAFCSPRGPYARLGVDLSSEATSNWTDGPSGARITMELGTLLRSKPRLAEGPAAKDGEKAFPEYEALKKRQEALGRELGD